MKINFSAPLNPLSFGQCSFNILREFYNKGVEVNFHPISNIDVSAFPIEQEMADKIKASINAKFDDLEAPVLKLWHFNDGGENRVGKGKSHLFTFHETSEPTDIEKKIAAVHDKVIVSSSYTKQNFNMDHFRFVPLGFDPDFHVLANPRKLNGGRVHWGLVGKWEHRKHTKKIIQTWLKKYGNDPKHHLTCVVMNPFFHENIMRGEIQSALQGQQYNNISFQAHMPQNAMMNDFLNSIDIDLSGLSGAEGWGLCSFNATALGKWSIVLNATSHKDWATKDNSILVEPDDFVDLDDGVFFRKGAPFNQGKFFTWNEETALAAMELAEKKFGVVNSNGLNLQKTFSYSNTVDQILTIINE